MMASISRLVDMSTTSKAIWLQNWWNMLQYIFFFVLREILDCFLLCHEVMADQILKQHPEVLFLSKTLPAQSESVYTYNLKS
jgi:predicted RNase H-like nuclease